ncbi:hypothetical protein E3N88_25502 [Mikania micrantha]|uniref:NAC domain-containing protein n=1 Tax=Mikania micrantha TaxID=192012 RepID=A0A5N6N544_9ASTR|nr:hypothetical protein E3N88_25502 [Mikania micrantha]
MMENYSAIGKEDDQVVLPPGFRFHPTDEELITHYLVKKVFDHTFSAKAIGEVDMNRIEPWQMPGLAKMDGKEWYFFCMRDKKYPTGLRTNRATDAGRAPKGEKTNWVIHEFRLEGRSSVQTGPKSKVLNDALFSPVFVSTLLVANLVLFELQNEWVICRVFHKSSGDKKLNSGGNGLPQLTESSTSSGSGDGMIKPESIHVPCFSNPDTILNNPSYTFDHNSNGSYSFQAGQSGHPLPDGSQFQFQFQFPSGYSFPISNQTNFNDLLRHNGDFQLGKEMDTRSHETENTEISCVMPDFETGKRVFDDQETPSTSVGPIDMDCIWNNY